MNHDDDGETSYNTFVDDVAFEPTYLQALLTAAGRNVATRVFQALCTHSDSNCNCYTYITRHHIFRAKFRIPGSSISEKNIDRTLFEELCFEIIILWTKQ